MKLFRQICFLTAIVCALIALPLIVLAADEAVGGAPQPVWWHRLLVDLVLGFGVAILGLLAKLLTSLFDFIAEKSGWAFLARVDDLMMEIVNDIYQAEIQPLKAAKADGVVTADELAKFKDVAIDRARSYLGMKGIKKLAGMVNGAGLNEVLGAKVERAVKASKVLGTAGKGSRLDPPKPSG